MRIVLSSDHIRDYTDYLESKYREVSENHQLQHPKRSESDADTLIVMLSNKDVRPKLVERYQSLWQMVSMAGEFQPVLVNEVMSTDTIEREGDMWMNCRKVYLHLFGY